MEEDGQDGPGQGEQAVHPDVLHPVAVPEEGLHDSGGHPDRRVQTGQLALRRCYHYDGGFVAAGDDEGEEGGVAAELGLIFRLAQVQEAQEERPQRLRHARLHQVLGVILEEPQEASAF
eukprot:CAMPEP_0170551632 /NCGR_PEP_ID=MMETSP0211-20121228/9636_1 /TAXON_ID=311385 /ORGANISM="Pseudokeronopsis sp., Strain OXSARD2" /LENGTH=118 /DNA_ID=CAMNT_0010858925 /DNA_START=102 /DNA_END=458 /DNA_ORIENTATION=-